MAKNKGLTRCIVHAFLDGRDVSPTSGRDFVAALPGYSARPWAWAKSPPLWAGITPWTGTTAGSGCSWPMTPWSTARASRIPTPWPPWPSPMPTMSPTSLWSPWSATPEGTISDNDSIIFFNFRPDRAREITRAIVDPEFDGFQPAVFSH
ncbi:MAG: hypothetical protein ACLR5H_12160 [Oscillospiraceae bacterium]